MGFAGAGGLLNYLRYRADVNMNPEDASGMNAALSIIGGMGAGYFMGTALFGKPFGLQARRFHLMSLQGRRLLGAQGRLGVRGTGIAAKTKDAPRALAASFGAAHMFAPRLTVGYMTEAALLGSSWGTLHALEQGMPLPQALYKGLQEGVTWMGYDLAFARFGSTLRWMGHVSDVRVAVNGTLAELGILQKVLPGLQTGRGQMTATQMIQRGVVNPSIGAGLGASIAAASGGDPQTGAIAGAVGATVAMPFLQRVSPLLPKSTIKLLADRKWSQLQPESVREIHQAIMQDAVDRVAAQTPLGPVGAMHLRRAIAKKAFVATERELAGLSQEYHRLNLELARHAPGEVLPDDPDSLKRVMRLGTRMLTIRERIGQLLREGEVGVVGDARVGIVGADGTVKIPGVGSVRAGKPVGALNGVVINEEIFRLERMSREARGRYEALSARARTAQSRRMAEDRARAEARALTTAAETELDFAAKTNEVYNARIALARKQINSHSIEEVYQELAKATGESVDDVTKRLGDPLAPRNLRYHLNAQAAYDELAYLRAGTGTPRLPITKQITRREGLTSEVRTQLKRFETLTEDVDNLLAAAEAGETITVQQLRTMLRKYGKGKVSGSTGGIVSIEFPYIGTIRDTATAALRKARIYLRDFKPELALSPVKPGKSLSTAGAFIVSPGFIEYKEDNGDDGLAWYASPTGAAALGAIGMVLGKRKGVPYPLRVQGFARLAREFLHRQSTKIRVPPNLPTSVLHHARRKGTMEAIRKRVGTNREGMVALLSDGDAIMLRGAEKAIDMKLLDKARRGRAVLFSLHNHPPNLRFLGSEDAKQAYVLGESIMQAFPSMADVSAHVRMRPVGKDKVLFGVITPTGGVSVVSAPANILMDVFSTELRILRNVESQIDREVMALGFSRKALQNMDIAEFFGRHARAYGPDRVTQLFMKEYRSIGVDVMLNVSDEALEQAIIASMKTGVLRNPAARAAATETRHLTENFATSYSIRKMNEPGARAALVKFLTGAPPKPVTVSRKVAPAGARTTKAPLPSSITPQEVSRPVRLLYNARQWAERHGMKITDTTANGRRVFQAITPQGVVSEAATVRELMTNIGALAKGRKVAGDLAADSGMGAVFSGERGSIPTDSGLVLATTSMGAVAGFPLGVFAGTIADSILRNPHDEEKRYAMAGVWGTVGAVTMAYLGAKFGRAASARLDKKFMRLFVPPDSEVMAGKEVGKLWGRPGKSGGPSEKQFLGFPIKDQVGHLRKRIEDAVNAANRKDSAKRSHLHNILRKFAPAHIPDSEWGALQSQVMDAAQHIGYTESQAHALWMGMVVRSTIPFTHRGLRQKGPSLFVLAKQDAPNIFGPEAALEEIREVYRAAEIITGLPPSRPTGSVRAAGKSFHNALTPEAQHYRELHRIADSNDLSFAAARSVEGFETMGMGPFGIIPPGLRSPEAFRSLGNRLLRDPNKREVGRMVLQLYESINIGTVSIRRDTEAMTVKLHQVFQGFSPAEREMIPDLLQNPERLALAATQNRKIYDGAMAFKAMVDDIAVNQLGIPKQALIKDYFPWIYNSKTLRDLQKQGFAHADDVFVPRGLGFPEYKIFRHLIDRTADAPLGDIIKDPLVVGQMYVAGAMRKKYLDRIFAQFDANWFKEFSRVQPFVASDMARWLLDISGVPRTTHIRAMARLRGIGLSLEKLSMAAQSMGFNTGDFLDTLIDRYFLGPGAVQAFSRFVRGFEFFSKLGGNLISPLVNLTQLSNTATDIGISSMMIGGLDFGFGAGAGRLAEKTAAVPGLRRMTGWISLKSGGPEKLKLAREIGVWSDNTRRIIDEMHDLVRRESTTGMGVIAMSGVIGGAVGTGLGGYIGDEQARLTEGLFGAGVATIGASVAPKYFRYALQKMRNTLVMPFTLAETVNRVVTAGGSQRAARSARKIAAGSPLRQRAAQVGDIAGNIGVGATAGAVAGAVTGEGRGDTTGERATSGAITGAAVGTAIGLAGARRPRYQRITGELDTMADTLSHIPHRSNLAKSLEELGPPTDAEIEKWYMRQVLDQTQFRFGKEGRAPWLRTTLGEILGSLQSFTINQMEFAGARWRSFIQSMAESNGVGKLDVRIFRHIALLSGAAGALTAASIGLETDRGYDYWASRIGIGLLPVLAWNQDAESWQMTDIAQHVAGPFFSDLKRATHAAWELSTNPVAQRKFDEQMDVLAKNIFTAFRQLESNVEMAGRIAEKMHLEGIAELAQEQQVLTGFSSSPFSTLVGTAESGAAGEQEGFGTGEGFGGDEGFGGGEGF
jgi:hypothetical protein